jgi:hypothetical protein
MSVMHPIVRRWSTLPRVTLWSSTLVCSWLLMQIIHESGHIMAAIATGGVVREVVLVPWQFSRTELADNPCPGIVVWAGPVLGVTLPLLMWGGAQMPSE